MRDNSTANCTIELVNTGPTPCPSPIEVPNAPGDFRDYTDQEARELGARAAASMIEIFSADKDQTT